MAACDFDSDMIDWDEEAPSSPFLTTVAESRQASASNPYAEIAEMDSLFGPSSPVKAEDMPSHSQTAKADSVEEEKENASPHHAIVDAKPAAPERPVSPQTSKDETSMGPPPLSASTNKQPLSWSPARPLASPRRPKASPFKNVQPGFKPQHLPAVCETSAIFEDTNLDDTCFSAFSAVPEMTLFSRLTDANKSPSRRAPLVMLLIALLIQDADRAQTPRETTPNTGRTAFDTSRSPSPTPRRIKESPNKDAATPSLLIDFTQQIGPHSTATRSSQLSPSRTEPNLLAYINDQRQPGKSRRESASPSKQSNLLNLLDFELPPPPTPRSTPTFSVREMESLKSAHQSQLLSIKAKLNGKEAEVESLKKALEDAERRVGEAQESARDEAIRREQAEQEKADWERRGLDVESVLKTVKQEILGSEEERYALSQRADEMEQRAEEAAAANLDLRAKLASAIASGDCNGDSGAGVNGEQIQQLVQLQLDQKIEGISRELHAVYKKKHETKVATLKKSYEARSERKCAELQSKLQELVAQNEQLAQARDSAHANNPAGGVSHNQHMELRRAAERYRAEIEEQNARMTGVDSEMRSIQADHARLLAELQQERVEKGDLVAAVDEMLSLQGGENSVIVEDFRRSISSAARTSGLKAPGTMSGAVSNSTGSRLGRPAVAGGLDRSKTMANVGRLGNRM